VDGKEEAFPVLWEERGMRGNLQGVFNHRGHRGHGGNRW